jgi:predicted PurR-regulated permease PerM
MSQAWMRHLFWVGLAAALLVVLELLRGILLPFALGAAIAFFLDPLVDQMVRVRLSRTFATVLALLVFGLVITLFFLLFTPLIQVEVTQLAGKSHDYLTAVRGEFDQLLSLLQDWLAPEDMQRLRDAAGAKLGDVVSGAVEIVTSVVSGGVAVANVLSLVFITPIVAFFLLRDWDQIVATVDSWLPRLHAEVIREQARLVHRTLSGFLRGQSMVCAIFGLYYAICLSILGLDFGLIVGLAVGVLIFIPFLGALSGGLIAAMLAAAQFGDWAHPLWVGGIFLVGQTLEGNVVTPKLVGDQVNLHPVWIIFSLLAFGALFGLTGVVVAVPFAAVLGVLLRFLLQRYLESPLYDPARAVPPSPEP